MADKKKVYPEAEPADMKIPETDMPYMGMPMMNGMCPMMYSCPMMCPMMYQMMQIPGMSAPMMDMEDMRDSDWYEEDDSDCSSDESDEYPYCWKPYKKHKHTYFPFLWPYFYPFSPYSKKYKK